MVHWSLSPGVMDHSRNWMYSGSGRWDVSATSYIPMIGSFHLLWLHSHLDVLLKGNHVICFFIVFPLFIFITSSFTHFSFFPLLPMHCLHYCFGRSDPASEGSVSFMHAGFSRLLLLPSMSWSLDARWIFFCLTCLTDLMCRHINYSSSRQLNVVLSLLVSQAYWHGVLPTRQHLEGILSYQVSMCGPMLDTVGS